MDNPMIGLAGGVTPADREAAGGCGCLILSAMLFAAVLASAFVAGTLAGKFLPF
jgi:hypothetical protein